MKTSHLTRIQISACARRNSLTLPDNIDRELEKYLDLHGVDDAAFCWLVSYGKRSLNAGLLMNRYVLFNAEWATQIVLFPSQALDNAFLQTYGHELSHKNDYNYFDLFTRNKKFVNWINEIHADFCSATLMLNSSREKLIEALEFKISKKKEKDISMFSHPSWQERIMYIKEYNFNESLIRKIAYDIGCKSELLINRVINHFDECLLHD